MINGDAAWKDTLQHEGVSYSKAQANEVTLPRFIPINWRASASGAESGVADRGSRYQARPSPPNEA